MRLLIGLCILYLSNTFITFIRDIYCIRISIYRKRKSYKYEDQTTVYEIESHLCEPAFMQQQQKTTNIWCAEAPSKTHILNVQALGAFPLVQCGIIFGAY